MLDYKLHKGRNLDSTFLLVPQYLKQSPACKWHVTDAYWMDQWIYSFVLQFLESAMALLPLISKQTWDKPQRSLFLWTRLGNFRPLPPELGPGVSSTWTSTGTDRPEFQLGEWGEVWTGTVWGMQDSRVCGRFLEALPWGCCPPAPDSSQQTSLHIASSGTWRCKAMADKDGVPPHCWPLISTNEFLCGEEQTAPQWDWPRPPQRGSLVSRAC